MLTNQRLNRSDNAQEGGGGGGGVKGDLSFKLKKKSVHFPALKGLSWLTLELYLSPCL